MPFRRELAALAAFALLGWRRTAAAPFALTGRALLYVVILAIFRQIWRATPLGELAAPAPTADGLLWYLAVTEWIVFAAGMPYREVEADIRNGDIAMALLRPLPYGLATLARWAGDTAYHLLALGGIGFLAAWAMTGTVPLALGDAPGIVIGGALGCALILLFHLQLGYAAAWLGSAAPAFWIWQKLAFVLGGLVMPLSFYPPPWGAAAALTPFAGIFYGPGALALGPDGAVLATLGQQAIWLVLVGAAAIAGERAATARFLADGV